MKKSYIFLFIIFMFIASCGNKVTAPSVSDITYYEPNNAIRKTYSYSINDGKTDAMITVEGTFKKLAESSNAIIYVEESQIDKGITKRDILSFLREFENYVPREIEIYGEIPDFDGNGKVIFLMANLNTNATASITGGYFSSSDLIYGKAGVPGEYLHINVPTSESTIGLMMHELQHLINYYNNAMQGKAMDIWLNEALSESTSHLFSTTLTDERKNLFINYPYYSFYSWYLMYTDKSFVFTPNHVLISYASSSMFMKWLDSQTGGKQEIYKEIAHSDLSLTTEERLLNITSKYSLGNDMNTVLLNWIEGINNGDIPGLRLSAIDPTDKNFNQNGSIPLLPKSLVVYSTANNNISGNKLLTRELGQTGLSVVINTSVNNQKAGFANKEDVVNLAINKAANLNSSIKYKRSNLTDELFHIDKVID